MVQYQSCYSIIKQEQIMVTTTLTTCIALVSGS